MAERRKLTATLSCAAALLGSLALLVPPASANVSHAFSGTYGASTSTPANAYPLSGPTDVEVDQTTHDFYVTDPGNHRVEKFDSTGHLLLMFGRNVNKTQVEASGTQTAKDTCVPATETCQAGASSSSAGGFENPYYLAVDNYSGGDGDVYVGDNADNLVSKFDSSGHLITSWGEQGQKNGSDAKDLSNGWQPVYGVAVGGGCATPTSKNTGPCSPNGTLYVGGRRYNTNVFEYTRSGEYIKWSISTSSPWLKVSPSGAIYSGGGPVDEAIPIPGAYQDTNGYQVTMESPTTGFNFDPSTEELYQDTGSQIDHYGGTCNPPLNGACEPIDTFGSEAGQLSGPLGVGVNGESHTVYVANSSANDVAVFSDVRPIVTTGAPGEATETSVTLTGKVDPAGRGAITSCHFEYGLTKAYGKTLPCSPDPASNPPSSNFTTATEVKATVSGISPGTHEHYRVVATNSAGATSEGVDEVAITTQPPAIDGLAAEHLTATTADLTAAVNPNGLETTYRFEYGTTTGYGQVEPSPDGTLSPSYSDHTIGVHLEHLVPHVVYHYRLVTISADGETVSGDQTFNFYPPSCPNENVRQQTQANYLPECRAYELVTPGEAGGTQFFPDGPNTGYATNPSRFSFTGVFSSVPGAGGSPIDGAGDLYVATRTDTGWETHYVGIPSNKAAVDGGPPLGPPGSTPWQECNELYYHSCFRNPSALAAASGEGATIQNAVMTDLGMNKFANFNDGNQSIESIFTGDFQNKTVIASNAPYVWNADGKAIDRWPTNLGTVPPGSYNGLPMYLYGSYTEGKSPETVAPGGVRALDCPYSTETGYSSLNADYCPGDVTSSADLTHFVFATEWNEFAPGGKIGAPGSVYDNNTITGGVAVASKLSNGENIPNEPTDGAGDPLEIPGVSQDGSHILMAAGGNGPCGSANCSNLPCGADYSMVRRCIMQPSHLYMRIDDTITKDVSQGHDVRFVGMDGSGSKVYFISEEHLTGEDLEHGGPSLYMWSEQGEEEGHPLTLISKANNEGNPGEPGNRANCEVESFKECGIDIYSQLFYCQLGSTLGGNCLSDNFIASETGDIYFTSPEQLDGTRGVAEQENLYVYRNGHAQYVATLSGPPDCYETYSSHTCTRIERMQVAPDDSHMAFVTNSQVTQYNNQGYQEMYTYNPVTRKVVCVSCVPSGEPPTSDVLASQDGLFMTNDGRTFFSTKDALVHADTNEAEDVYEYVEGRPQLITPGTGDTSQPLGGALGFGAVGGLIGVSADGRDVYFGTYQTLVPSDHNGLFFKVYDARSGGGFPANPPAASVYRRRRVPRRRLRSSRADSERYAWLAVGR